MRLRRTLAAAVSSVAVLLSGCGALSGGVYDAPLPGGADVGDDPITLTAEFTDVLDLVPQSAVKLDNVDVGRVTDVELGDDGTTAEVELLVRGDLDLPAGTTARLQQTSLLGEKYVALVRPGREVQGKAGRSGADSGGTGAAAAPGETGELEDGDVLGTGETDQAATTEQVLGALSLVLNGGGVGQFQEISRELQAMGGGRTEGLKNFLDQLGRFVRVLDRRSGAITGAIDGLAELSATLDGDKERIANTLEELSPGLEVMEQQRPDFVAMLEALDDLSDITVETLDAAQEDMVADLKLLRPILANLAEAGSNLPNALEILLTYPFPDSVLGTIRGDYLNVFLTTNFRTLPAGCREMGCAWPQPGVSGGSAARHGRKSSPPSGSSPPPTMLPPTDSPVPGTTSPTVPGPSIDPSDPSGSGGSGSGSPSTPGSSAPWTPGSSDPGTPSGPTSDSPSGAATTEGGE
jgi:phospholipid/cholesterol/gamma-HCH transport system substrate-binding protein